MVDTIFSVSSNNVDAVVKFLLELVVLVRSIIYLFGDVFSDKLSELWELRGHSMGIHDGNPCTDTKKSLISFGDENPFRRYLFFGSCGDTSWHGFLLVVMTSSSQATPLRLFGSSFFFKRPCMHLVLLLFDVTGLVNLQFFCRCCRGFYYTGLWLTSSLERVRYVRVQPRPSGADRCGSVCNAPLNKSGTCPCLSFGNTLRQERISWCVSSKNQHKRGYHFTWSRESHLLLPRLHACPLGRIANVLEKPRG